MAKTWKTIDRKVTIFHTMTCDICSKVVTKDDWSTGSYEVADTEISIREGSSYPEGGFGTELTFDICMECFREKLIPWFNDQKITGTMKEWEF